jgi:hypothetical protein
MRIPTSSSPGSEYHEVPNPPSHPYLPGTAAAPSRSRRMTIATPKPHPLAADAFRADRVRVHLASPADERDEAGQLATLDVAGHDVVHAVESHPGQSSGARHSLLRSEVEKQS